MELELVKSKRQRSGYNKELSINNKSLVKVEYGFINKKIKKSSNTRLIDPRYL